MKVLDKVKAMLLGKETEEMARDRKRIDASIEALKSRRRRKRTTTPAFFPVEAKR